jgi:hypothetical protein
MSQALASARKRRAPPEPVPTTRPGNLQQQQQGVNTPGLTLPQVIALVDKRLTALELHAKEQLAEKQDIDQSSQVQIQNAPLPSNIAEVLDEYSSRFDIIAEELASLKNMLLTLQSFTMEVNKTLMQDRIRILSEAPTPLERALAEN